MKEHLYTIDFSQFKAEELRNLFEQHKARVLGAIEELTAKEVVTADDLYGEKSYADLLADELHYNPMFHLKAVMDEEKYREAINALIEDMTLLSTQVMQNEKMYQVYKKLADSADFASLPQEQRKDIENTLLDYRLSGISLNAEDKAKYTEIATKLSQVQNKFSNNSLDDRQAWTKHIPESDKELLAGLNENQLALLHQFAQAKGLDGYLLNLEAPVIMMVMKNAKNRELRKEYFHAFAYVASPHSTTKGKYDNTQNVEEIVKLRQEKAKLLGFNNYAELSLATKMAETPAQVLDFLYQLRDAAIDKAQAQYELIKAFAKEKDGIEDFQPWDLQYYQTKYFAETFDIDHEEIRKYFPQTKVFAGMFEIFKRLYNIEFVYDESVKTYHPDVKFYKVYEDGKLIAGVYFDLFARSGKRDGAWMDWAFGRFETKENLKLPVTYITCNFIPPLEGKDSYLSTDEVNTLFHEMGHGLHLLLTKVKTQSICGTSVEWDAVELPSQVHENWVSQLESLRLMTAHQDTGETIPEELVNRLLEAKKFSDGPLFLVRQLEFGIFDMELYSRPETDTRSVQQVWEDVRATISNKVFGRFILSTMPCTFGHIFSGGYAAGYYSYLWAEVLAADAFEAYLEKGDIFDREVATAFKDNILAVGGTYPSMESYVRFRGRKPDPKALFKLYNIA